MNRKITEDLIVLTQTPMRLTLAGGGTDVLWYSKIRGGAWISGALDKYVRVLITSHEEKHDIRLSDIDLTSKVSDYRELPNPIVKAALKMSGVTSGVQIYVSSDASAMSGLGGSGAFEVGLLHALYNFAGRRISKLELAKAACEIEIRRLKKPVGPQDQYIAALGGIKYFEIDTNGRVYVESLKLSRKTIDKLANNLFFFTTGIQRSASHILSDQKRRVQKKANRADNIIHALDDIKTLGQRAKKYLLEGKVDDFGATFHEHWLIKKRLSKKISSSKIDVWYNQAIKAGALGGKIMGAGGGGWFVFYVPRNKEKFRKQMYKIGLDERKVGFDWKGTRLINLS